LYFFYQPSILTHGVGWIFPHGSTASIGLGSYRGPKPLKKALSQFADRHDLKVGQIHGTRFPSRLSSPTEGPLFIVGDAAGMCLGMTGEGIRPALFFGEACGRIIRRTLEGQISLEQGLTEYRDFVYAYREFFTIFTLAQFILTRLPTAWIDGVARIFRNDRIRHWFLQQYWGLTRSWDEVGVQSRKQY
jgi:flavin-dependent dehydrogenase